MSIISAIISAIMSFLMIFFPGIGGGDGDEIKIDVDTIRVVDVYKGDFGVISDYNTWKKTSVGANDKKFNKDFFEDHSVVVMRVTLPSPQYEVVVKSAVEKGSKLEVNYKLYQNGGFSIQIPIENVIIVPVSKNVKTYSANEIS